MISTMYRIILVAFLFAVACIGGTERASAQGCCNFRIIVSNAVPAGCMPLSVTTSWGGTAQTDVVVTRGNGNPPVTIGVPCPPVPAYNWVSLDGGLTTFAGFGLSPCYNLPCGNVMFDVSLNPITGCLEIRIVPCP
jgi:hypothetical protein